MDFKENIHYDKLLEQSILGVLLLEPRSYSEVRGLIKPNAFFIEANKHLCMAIEFLYEKGIGIDYLTVNRELYKRGKTELGSPEYTHTGDYLTALISNVVTSAHLKHWSLMLLELATNRLVFEKTAILHAGATGDKDPLDLAQELDNQVKELLDVKVSDDWVDASKAALMLTESMERAADGDNGIPTSFKRLDQLNGGFKDGQLIIIGARPAVGKSALMGRITEKAASKGYKVGVISLEMPISDVLGRIVSNVSGVEFQMVAKNLYNDEDQRKATYDSIAKIAALPIYFAESVSLNAFDIRAKAETLHAKHGLNMLIIDYLQLIEENVDKGRSREQAVSKISRELKMIAMNLKIPVIALSQLNRESDKRSDKKPSMSDIRESGAIEQDADVIMLLHRDYQSGITVDKDGNSTENEADLLIAKWRNGETRDIKLRFHGATMSFSDPKEECEMPQDNPKAGLPTNLKHLENPPF